MKTDCLDNSDNEDCGKLTHKYGIRERAVRERAVHSVYFACPS